MTSHYRYIVQQREKAKEAEAFVSYCADCNCKETDHRAVDADCVNGSFVALPRPCKNCNDCLDYRDLEF